MKPGWLKLGLINIGVTLGLLFGLNFLILFVSTLIPTVSAWVSGEDIEEDDRAQLRNYADDPELAATHFREFEYLETQYRSFIEWTRSPYQGETITINEAGDRVHANAPTVTDSPTAVYLFGGSTMWGTGVLDDQTIPAYFQALSQRPSTNKGETAFVSRQSLNQFANLLATEPDIDTVVFYEGVNDVQYHCRADIGLVEHARLTRFETAIATDGETNTDRARLQRADFVGYLDTVFLRGIRRVAMNIGDSLAPDREVARIDKSLLCDNDPALAEQVAQNLLLNWEMAYQIAEARGIDFVAVLQPVTYLDDSPVDHLELDEELGRQFTAVYPILQQLIEDGDYPWILDYTNVFDSEEYVYIDFCHLSANGNRRVADQLHQDLASVTD